MPLPTIETLDLQEIRAPFDDPEWLFEVKYDGFRSLAYLEAKKCRLVSRNDHTYKRFTALREAIPADIDAKNAIIDGELAVLDDKGQSQFYDLMFNRAQPIFAAFDLLYLNGKDLRDRALLERKAMLRKVIRKRAAHVLYVNHIVGNGKALYKQVCARDLEGIVAKPAISRYREIKGQSPWIKIRNPKYSQKEGRADLFNKRR